MNRGRALILPAAGILAYKAVAPLRGRRLRGVQSRLPVSRATAKRQRTLYATPLPRSTREYRPVDAGGRPYASGSAGGETTPAQSLKPAAGGLVQPARSVEPGSAKTSGAKAPNEAGSGSAPYGVGRTSSMQRASGLSVRSLHRGWRFFFGIPLEFKVGGRP